MGLGGARVSAGGCKGCAGVCRGCRLQFTQGGAKCALVSKIWGKGGGRNFYNTVFAIIKGVQLSKGVQGGCRGVQIAVYAGWRKVCTSVTTDGGTGGEAVETTLRLSLP